MRRKILSRGLGVALIGTAWAATAGGQTQRVATTAEALLAYPRFFHGRTVVVQQRVVQERDLSRLAEASKPIYIYWRNAPSETSGEIRGEFWDLGRTAKGDARFTGTDFTSLLEAVTQGRWPTRDEVYVLLNASLLPADPPRTPTVRAIALTPGEYMAREVSLVGRFKGRNLYGELPAAIGKGKWDFVIASADGALWVTGVRPRGDGFNLDPDRRVDTGRWVEVKGVVKQDGVLPYLEATTVALAAEPEAAPVEVELPPTPRQPPPEVIFSAPIPNDTEIETSAPVRIQFSRDLDPRTVRGRVRVTYASPEAAAQLKAPAFTAVYNDAARAVEIKFTEPLERFQQVKVELLEGITALDGQPLPPWSLTFTTGAR